MIWANRAYPSLLGLSAWFVDLLLRLRELETWATDFVVCIMLMSYNYVYFKILRTPVTFCDPVDKCLNFFTVDICEHIFNFCQTSMC